MITHCITLAYVAGLFDGEGSIVIGVSPPNKKQGKKSPSHWLQVGIGMTDKPTIEWLHVTFGGHISSNHYATSKGTRRNCYVWRIMSQQAMEFLRMLLPYLRYKKPQAQIAIEFQETRIAYRQGRTGLSPDVLAVRERYRHQLRKLTLGHNSSDP